MTFRRGERLRAGFLVCLFDEGTLNHDDQNPNPTFERERQI